MASLHRMAFVAILLAGILSSVVGNAEERTLLAPIPADQPTPAQARWEKLKYGMFIHFGMSTFTQVELDTGTFPSTTYSPTDLDVRQWIRVAKEAGMKYAVLTTKHVAGHCLWDAENYDYDVATSGNPVDVVAEFMAACKAEEIEPGFYYCVMDGRNEGHVTWDRGIKDEYFQFILRQLAELHTRYPGTIEQWVDIPWKMNRAQRAEVYHVIKEHSPECLVMMNAGYVDGVQIVPGAWPADLCDGEVTAPPQTGHNSLKQVRGKTYYVPMEVCHTLTKNWFFVKNDPPRSVDDLYTLYDHSVNRNANLLLDVAPDVTGKIPAASIERLMELKQRIDAEAKIKAAATPKS